MVGSSAGQGETMIGHDGNKPETTYIVSAAAGATSGALTRLILQPMDVVKIRLQLQVEPIKSRNESSKYRGIFQAVRLIYREETIAAFWKGHMSAQMLSIVYGIGQFVTYEEMTKIMKRTTLSAAEENVTNFFCGSAATGVATLVSFPFDVVRTRFVAQGEPKVYKTLFQAFSKMYRSEGFTSLYKGMTPTLIQSVPYGGCQFGFYAIFTNLNEKLGLLVTSPSPQSDNDSPVEHLVAGFLAGLCAKAVCYPFDLCRKRLQIQGFQDVRKGFGKAFICNGMIDCMAKIYKEESISGFFKGLQPALIKSACVTSLYFTLYEAILGFLKIRTVES